MNEDINHQSLEGFENKNSPTDVYAHLSSIIDTIAGNHWWKDKNGRYIGCNQRVATFVGLNSPQDIVGKTDYELPWAKDADALIKHDQLVMNTGKTQTHEESVRDQFGNMLFFVVTKAPLKDSSGHIIGTIGTSVDITDQKRLERDLLFAKSKAEEANKAKTDFISNISHDFVTSLTNINGLANLLLEKKLDNESEEYLGDIISSSNILIGLIKDIINFSKIEHEHVPVRSELIDIDALVKEIKSVFSLLASNKNVSLVINNKTNFSTLKSDKNRLTRILVNLIGNALKFTTEGAVIVNFLSDIFCLVLVVKDTGIGIPEDKQQAIFEKFGRLEAAYAGNYEGVGLGLSIVDLFVKDLKGTIKIKSQLGLGTTFEIKIPCEFFESAAFNTPVVKEKIIYQEDKKNITVLLIEDNKIVIKVVTHQLENADFFPIIAETAQEGYDLLMNNASIDIIITDLGLPDKNGLDLIKDIRSSTQLFSKLPIIVLTANLSDEEREKAFDAGANAFLVKSTPAIEIKEKIFSLLSDAN